jgi:starch synthase
MENDLSSGWRTIRSGHWTPQRSRRAPLRSAVKPASRGVVHLTAECWPYARTGGLGEMVSALASHQAAAGTPVTVMLPLYRCVRTGTPRLDPLGAECPVVVGPRIERVRLYTPRAPRPGGPDRLSRPARSVRPGRPVWRSWERLPGQRSPLLLPCRTPGVTADRAGHAGGTRPRLARCTGPGLSAHRARQEPAVPGVTTVLSVHNAAFQGLCPVDVLPALGLP